MFDEDLARLASQHLLRQLRPLHSAVGPTVELEGRRVLLFASNDYLGLATHPSVAQAAVQATERYGAGSGAARLISGSLPPHQEMEQELARFKDVPSVLSFGSGYLTNIGVIPALIAKGGLILADRLCHASLIDGCQLSGADFRIYRHNDMDHLSSLLARRTPGRPVIIVTDGVFSMDGDLAPLPDLIALAETHGAQLYVDDAHGTGVLGKLGRGTIEHFGLEGRIPFHMGTLSKALGSSGGFVAGPESFTQFLMNRARSFIFTTAPTPGSAAAVTAAIGVIRREPERRARLWSNRDRLWQGLVGLGFSLAPSASPILPILVGDAEKALRFSERLLTLGVLAPAVRPPTVPDDTSRVRVTVTSEHTLAQLDEALLAFRRAGEAAKLL